MSSSAARAWWSAAALCLLVATFDQLAKTVVEARLIPGEHVDVLGPLQITLTHNTGVAFGLAGGGGAALIALTLVALCFVGFLFARDPTRPWMWIAFGLLAGGAIGNLIDRISEGAVTDFIELPHWPPFNLADMAVTAGVLILVVIYLREEAG